VILSKAALSVFRMGVPNRVRLMTGLDCFLGHDQDLGFGDIECDSQLGAPFFQVMQDSLESSGDCSSIGVGCPDA
jgi:hypothetical protein